MCTLTWKRHKPSGFEVFFNRDELKSRPLADPPTRFQADGVSFLSPRDPKGGGTWMLANEFGMVICLLNKWELESRSQIRRTSRGNLVLSMASVAEIREIPPFLHDLRSYPAFSLMAFSPRGENLWEWDGRTLVERPPVAPLTSSSYRFEDVKSAREAVYASGLRGRAYHATEFDKPSAFTVRMCRPDAQTWSRSRVTVGQKITWEYLAEPADLVGEVRETKVELNLK